MNYYIPAWITLLSALLGLVFAVGAVRAGQGAEQTNGLYWLARSAALTGAALVPFLFPAPWLLALITGAMLVVQAGDTLVGIFLRRPSRAAGPLCMAVLHGVCLKMVLSLIE